MRGNADWVKGKCVVDDIPDKKHPKCSRCEVLMGPQHLEKTVRPMCGSCTLGVRVNWYPACQDLAAAVLQGMVKGYVHYEPAMELWLGVCGLTVSGFKREIKKRLSTREKEISVRYLDR